LLKIELKGEQLQFAFHKIHFPMTHFHYERFDTPDDEQDGKWSVNFATNPEGDVDHATISLDEADAVFTRKAPTIDAALTERLAGTYETQSGLKFQVVARPGGELYVLFPGAPEQKLTPYKGLKFRITEFADVVFEFVEENGKVTFLKQTEPSGEYVFTRK